MSYLSWGRLCYHRVRELWRGGRQPILLRNDGQLPLENLGASQAEDFRIGTCSRYFFPVIDSALFAVFRDHGTRHRAKLSVDETLLEIGESEGPGGSSGLNLGREAS